MTGAEKNLKMLVIGSSILDIIEDGGSVIMKPGGIYYTLSALDVIKNENDEIFVMTNYDQNNFSYFENLYNRMNITFSEKIEEISKVHLKIVDKGERIETYCNVSPKIRMPANIDYNNFDGILINMITGFDIDIQDLQTIREKFGKKIYIDFHTLTRSLEKNNRRVQRKIPNVEKWLKNVDIIQVNVQELFSLSDKSSENEIIEEILSNHSVVLIVTRASNGSTLYQKVNKEIKVLNQPAIEVNSINTIGCGDVFGSAFFYSYIKNGNLEYSLKLANSAAGIITTVSDFRDFNKLKFIKELI